MRRPQVGDRVRLTNQAIESIGGLHTWEEIQAAQEMTVTKVSESAIDGTAIYLIEVDGHFSHLPLTHLDIEPIQGGE